MAKQKLTAAQCLAANVRELRKERFGSVQAAVTASGISVARWYRIEQGKYSGMVGFVVDPLAALFNCSRTDLLKPPKHQPKRKESSNGTKRKRTSRTGAKTDGASGDRA